MGRAPMWRRYLRLLGPDPEADVREEIEHHLEMRTRDLVARGMEPEAARREARRRFGDVERVRREVEEIDRQTLRWRRRGEWWAGVGLDLRHAVRVLRKSPGFTAAAVLTLALGIGATTTLFGVVDALFLRPPAGVRAAGEVVRLPIVRDEGMIQTGPRGGSGSYVDMEAMRAGVAGFADVAAVVGPTEIDLGRGEDAERIRGSAVSRNFFSLLGVRPALGRFFLAEEDGVAGAHPVAVISHGFWERHFGGERGALGEVLLLNGKAVEVVGVAQPGFTGTDPDPVDVWVPAAMAAPLGLMSGGSEDWRRSMTMAAVQFVARLERGADRAQVEADAAAALRRAAAAEPGMDQTPGVLLEPLVPARRPQHSRAASLALWLLVMAGVVLVIAGTNVANLLLARATTRRREIAVRLSLGASRGRVVRHHLLESLLLALGGGAVGVVLALWGTALIRRFPLPAAAGETSPRAIAFALAVAVATGLVFGLVPALRSLGAEPAEELRDSQPGSRPERGRTRRALVALQVALSVVLLVGAGLFVRSVRAVTAIDPGLAYDRLLIVSADFRSNGFSDAEREAFYAAARDRVERLPGVEGAAMTHFGPFSGASYGTDAEVPGRELPEIERGPYLNWVGPGYFGVAGTRILRGRPIEENDRAGSEPVAVVNEAMARHLAGAGSPVVGECLELGAARPQDGCIRIVGVAEDQRQRYLEGDVPPAVLLAREQNPGALSWGGPTLLVRTRGEPGELAAEVRSALQGLSAELPYVSVQPVEERIRSELLPYRLGATLFVLFGALALVLAGIGLYGVLGYFVGERTPEIGIRRALGATDPAVVRMVVGQGLVPVGVGLALGGAASLAGARYLESLLFQVSVHDPAVYAVVGAFLVSVALLASYSPARRAAAVDPMTALRHD